MNDFNRVAQRVIELEDSRNLHSASGVVASILGPKAPTTAYVQWDGKHSCIMDFESAANARIAVNLINSGSAREAVQSLKSSGGSDPFEGGKSYSRGW